MYRGVFTSSFQRCFICDTKISGATQAEAERGIRHGEPERQKRECNSFETSGRSIRTEGREMPTSYGRNCRRAAGMQRRALRLYRLAASLQKLSARTEKCRPEAAENGAGNG